MDFSENVAASEAADLAYAKWYAKLPDGKKAEFFLSGYNFVADKIRHDVEQKNPFSTEADKVKRFIELTQGTDCPPATFTFMLEKMAKRSEEEWKQRFRAMKKKLGWSYNDMARFMGAGSGASVKASVNRQLPAFAKLAVCIFEQLEERG